jgi:hypothetical protein
MLVFHYITTQHHNPEDHNIIVRLGLYAINTALNEMKGLNWKEQRTARALFKIQTRSHPNMILYSDLKYHNQ